MLIGTILQTVILFVILFRTRWEKEVTKHVSDTSYLEQIIATRSFLLAFGFLTYSALGDAGYASRREGTSMGRKRRAADHPRNEMKIGLETLNTHKSHQFDRK
jgi:hypothetical protein